MKMASASFLFCRDECRRIERSSFGKNNCILLFRRRERDRLKQRRMEVKSKENVKGKMAILMKQIIVSILRDAIYNTSLFKYYNSKRKILSFLLIEINLIICKSRIFYFKFYKEFVIS